MNDDKLNHEPENVYSRSGVNISGHVNTGGGDFIGRDQIIRGFSSEQVSELLEQFRKKFQPKAFDGRSPYVGLESFQEEDADRFFGRDKLVDKLLKRLNTSQFVMLTGPSGSGKSSVIQAGLIPELKRGIIQGSDRWLYTTLRPGRDPLASLGRGIAGLVGQSSVVKEFQEQGLENYSLLADWAEIALGDHPNNHILFVIDQFEEIFTQLSDKDEPIRLAFLQQLENAHSVEINRTIFLLAMRSDFIGQCAAYPGLNALINQQFLQLGAMSQDELVSAIARPALEVGLRIDPDLVAQVLSDMREQSGSLPLMQFAMADLFHAEQESGGVVELTLERYIALGGLRLALQRHADAAFARLSQTEQELARRVFKGLVQPGFGTVDTARTARFNELETQGSNPQEVNSVIHKLADARLVTTDEHPDDEPTVRLVHEQLLEAWPWLMRLVDENRKAITIQNEIHQDALLWKHNGYDESYLYTGARLETAHERLEEEKIHLNEIAASFVEAGIQLKFAEEKEKQEEQRKKIEDTQRLAEEQRLRADELATAAAKMRSRAMIITAVGVVAVVLAILAGIFYFQAQNNADTARARELAALASNQLDRKPVLARLLSIEAYRIRDLPQTRQALFSVWNNKLFRLLSGVNTNLVTSVAWSPDGQLATGSHDGTVIIWDLESGEPEFTLEGHSASVRSVAWSPDGRLASGSEDGTVIVWDLQSGDRELTLEGLSDGVGSVAWSPDGRLASGLRDSTIIVWDLESGRPEVTLEGGPIWGIGVAWSPDEQLASGSYDGTVIVWDLQSGDRELTLEGHSGNVSSVAWSPDGRLASGSDDNTVIVWDLESGRPEVALEGHTDIVYSIAWSQDGLLASGSGDGTIIVWDLETGEVEMTLEGPSQLLMSLAWSPDERLALGSLDGTVIIWDLESGEPEFTLEGHSGSVRSVAWSPDGRLASGSYDNTVIVWELERGEPEVIAEPKETMDMFFTDRFGVLSVAWSPSGRLTIGDGYSLVRFLIRGRQSFMDLWGHAKAVSSVAWSPDGRLASGSWDDKVIVWDLERFEPGITLMGHSSIVNSVAWSPDEWLASGSYDGTIIVWDLESGEPEFTLEGHSGIIYSVTWSPDGQLASGSADGRVIVWDEERWEPEMILTGHTDSVLSVAWSSDGQLASGSEDGTVIVWDLESGIPDLTLEGHTDIVTSVAWSPDGRLASGSDDGTVIVWQMNPEVWFSQACQRAGRNLTQAEWDFYLPGETYRKTCNQWPLETP